MVPMAHLSVAEAVLRVLYARAGFDKWWYSLRDEAQLDILEDVQAVIEREFVTSRLEEEEMSRPRRKGYSS